MTVLFAHGSELHADHLLLIVPLLLVALAGVVLMIRGARSPDGHGEESDEEEQQAPASRPADLGPGAMEAGRRPSRDRSSCPANHRP